MPHTPHDPAAPAAGVGDLNVYVPQVGKLAWILPGAGIVGTPLASLPGKVCIDYEGNRYNSQNLRTFAQRVHAAADRHRSRYPTIARALVDHEKLVWVGAYDPATRSTTLGNGDAVCAWLQNADTTFSEADLATELANPTDRPWPRGS